MIPSQSRPPPTETPFSEGRFSPCAISNPCPRELQIRQPVSLFFFSPFHLENFSSSSFDEFPLSDAQCPFRSHFVPTRTPLNGLFVAPPHNKQAPVPDFLSFMFVSSRPFLFPSSFITYFATFAPQVFNVFGSIVACVPPPSQGVVLFYSDKCLLPFLLFSYHHLSGDYRPGAPPSVDALST